MTNPIVDQMIGRTIAHYEILARRGGGGMGVVYEARDTKLGRRVALKFLPPQWSHDEAAKQRFVREAQAASATDHPHICTIHDIGATGDGQLFIVMAYYEGETLKQRLARGPLPLHEALDIATQVADGLAKAHANGVVHRDIKPGNLIVTEDGVRIVDFGLATFADALQLTVPGSTLGTAAYMAPEQARGDEADARADVWAVGVILYEMLTGHVPFRGAYAEAIAYAIRNDPPAPVRDERPEVPEEVEQLVFRALHKDPAIRYQNGRELARALRQARGFTVPLDLRTQEVHAPAHLAGRRSSERFRPRPGFRVWTAAAALTIVALLGLAWGAFWWSGRDSSISASGSVPRTVVAVAPALNVTGDPTLNDYRLALTYAFIDELRESPHVRAVPFERVLEAVEGLSARGTDITSGDALQAIVMHTGAPFVLVPTLTVDDQRAWRGQVAVRDSQTAINVAEYEAAPITSVLAKDTAYTLVTELARLVERRFAGEESASPPRLRPPSTRLRTLDAVKAMAEGIGWYQDLEYGRALDAFRRAAAEDTRSPIAAAWVSRTAALMRRDDDARDAAAAATRLVTNETTPGQRLFVDAVVAESRGDVEAARRHYTDAAARYPDDPWWVLELAGFEERQRLNSRAVVDYHKALGLSDGLLRPLVALCRLYSPSRLNESANARTFGERALAAYRSLGNRLGEAQALLCLADTLRFGTVEDRSTSAGYAAQAAEIFEQAKAVYNIPRAHYYTSIIAGMQGRYNDSLAEGETALAGAQASGNAVLEPLILNNLGVTHAALGNVDQAASYYERVYKRYESLGDEVTAAQVQANRGAMLIDSRASSAGLEDVRNALAVVAERGDKNFEVFCRQVIAAYYRYRGNHAAANLELQQALAIAAARGLKDAVASITVDRARSHFLLAEYGEAASLLQEVLKTASGPSGAEARVRLARVYVRIGDFAAAQKELDTAIKDLGSRRSSMPLVDLALGELAYESGRAQEAMTHLRKAAEASERPQPDAVGVEALSYVAVLTARAGRSKEAAGIAESAVKLASQTGQFPVEARSRIALARIRVEQRQFDDALTALEGLDATADRTPGKELDAQLHYWRGRALAGRGEAKEARVETDRAQALIEELRRSLPAAQQPRFLSRPDVQVING